MLAIQGLFRNISIPTAIVFHLLIFGPLLLQLFFFDRSSKGYQFCWQWLVRILSLVSVSTFLYVMWMPYYSQVSHRTTNPGGPSGDMFLSMRFLLFLTSVAIPSFPSLFLLGLFPPKSYSQEKQWKIRKILPIGAMILASLIFIKYRAFVADRHQHLHPTYTPAELEEAKLRRERELEERKERNRRGEERQKEEQREILREFEEREEVQRKRLEEGERKAESMNEKERASWELQKKEIVERLGWAQKNLKKYEMLIKERNETEARKKARRVKRAARQKAEREEQKKVKEEASLGD